MYHRPAPQPPPPGVYYPYGYQRPSEGVIMAPNGDVPPIPREVWDSMTPREIASQLFAPSHPAYIPKETEDAKFPKPEAALRMCKYCLDPNPDHIGGACPLNKDGPYFGSRTTPWISRMMGFHPAEVAADHQGAGGSLSKELERQGIPVVDYTGHDWAFIPPMDAADTGAEPTMSAPPNEERQDAPPTYKLNADTETDSGSEADESQNLQGTDWPPPANAKSGCRYYLWLNSQYAPTGIYSHQALLHWIKKKHPTTHSPWEVGSRGDGMGFKKLNHAIQAYKKKYGTRGGVRIRWG